jgi:uncharacterized protein YecT (DUF1311 family)
MKQWAVVPLFLGSFSMALLAADGPPKKHPLDLWLDGCTQRDPSTRGMNECLAQAYAGWDQELNRTYRELLSRLDEASQDALRESQRAWIAFRDREFTLLDKLYGSMEGTMYVTMRLADRVDLIKRRTLELQSYADVLNSR